MLEKTSFKLNTPYISLEDKLVFLQEFVHPDFKLTYANKRLSIDIKLDTGRLEDKLLNRIGVYLKTNSLTLGSLNYEAHGLTYQQAKEALLEKFSEINRAFNLYIKNNEPLISGIQSKIEQGKIRFEELFNPIATIDTPKKEAVRAQSGFIYNVHKDWQISDYQLSFINKMLQGMAGINAFDVGLGKAQPLTSKVLTPKGWVRMGDLKVGDEIYAYNGDICRVLAIFPQGVKQTFEVIISDGSRTRCCKEHLWFTQTLAEKEHSHYFNVKNGVQTLPSGSVKKLEDIELSSQHALPTVVALPFNEKTLPLHPYFLGSLLGQFNQERVKNSLHLPFWQVNSLRLLGDKKIKFSPSIGFNTQINHPDFSSKGFIPEFTQVSDYDLLIEDGHYKQVLKELELYEIEPSKRFIPQEYKFSSIQQRIELLQGIFDCAAYFKEENKSIFARTYSYELACDIKEIVQSLGGSCSIRQKGEYWTMKSTLSNSLTWENRPLLPFRNPEQVERFIQAGKMRALRTIQKIEPYGEEECQCIKIDHPSHLYITDDFIVTHNTSTSLISVQNLHNNGVKQKTLFVVPNAALSNFEKEAYKGDKTKPPVLVDDSDSLFIYPCKGQAELLKQWKKALDPNIKKVFCTYESFFALSFKPETLAEYLKYQVKHDDSFAFYLEANNTKLVRFLARLEKMTNKLPLYFEDFNFDSIVIDELHAYKNSKEVWGSIQAKYLPLSPPSARGLDAQVKCWYIRQYNKELYDKEDGVLGLTATPLTNSPYEFYSILTLVVGEENLNNLIGLNSSFDFLLSSCEVEADDDYSVDGETKSFNVFKGIKNLSILRPALFKIITFLTHENVRSGFFIPKEKVSTIQTQLSETQFEKLSQYKTVYNQCKTLVFGSEEQQASILNSAEWLETERFLSTHHEDEKIASSPFNFIRKMERLILDEDCDLQGLRIKLENPTNLTEIEAFIEKFNQKKKRERRIRPTPRTVNYNELKDEEGETVGYDCEVGIYWLEPNVLILDSSEYKTQQSVYKALKKITDISLFSSNKIDELINNLNEQIQNPRGKIKGEKVPFVKQIVFCDQLSVHFKLQQLLHERCQVKMENIHILTGEINGEPSEVIDLQNKFNFETNEHTILIANEKAEVNLNLQVGTQAIHHLTIGWTPDSIHQRNGRAARYGNETSYVEVYFYDAENTFDNYKRRLVNHKEGWISKMVSQDGEDFIAIEHNLTKEQYEKLIQQLGEDLANLEEEWEREREQKKREKRLAEQKLYLRTLLATQPEANKDFFLDFINNSLKQIALFNLEREKYKGKEGDLAYLDKTLIAYQEKMAEYYDIANKEALKNISRRVLKSKVVLEKALSLEGIHIKPKLVDLFQLRKSMGDKLRADCIQRYKEIEGDTELLNNAIAGKLIEFNGEFIYPECLILVDKPLYNYSTKHTKKPSEVFQELKKTEPLDEFALAFIKEQKNLPLNFKANDLPEFLKAVEQFKKKFDSLRQDASYNKQARLEICETFGELLKSMDFTLFSYTGEDFNSLTSIVEMVWLNGKSLSAPLHPLKISIEDLDKILEELGETLKVIYPTDPNFEKIKTFNLLRQLYNAYVFSIKKNGVSPREMESYVEKLSYKGLSVKDLAVFDLKFVKLLLEMEEKVKPANFTIRYGGVRS